MAEREGFEPPEARASTVFKTAAFDHSATSPDGPIRAPTGFGARFATQRSGACRNGNLIPRLSAILTECPAYCGPVGGASLDRRGSSRQARAYREVFKTFPGGSCGMAPTANAKPDAGRATGLQVDIASKGGLTASGQSGNTRTGPGTGV